MRAHRDPERDEDLPWILRGLKVVSMLLRMVVPWMMMISLGISIGKGRTNTSKTTDWAPAVRSPSPATPPSAPARGRPIAHAPRFDARSRRSMRGPAPRQHVNIGRGGQRTVKYGTPHPNQARVCGSFATAPPDLTPPPPL